MVLKAEQQFPDAPSGAWRRAGEHFDAFTDTGGPGRRITQTLSDRARALAIAAERPEPPARPALVKRLFEWVRERAEAMLRRLRPARRLAGTDPRSVAAYLDEPAMAHFARELDQAAAEAAITDQGDGPVDVTVIECAVAGGYGSDAAAANAVTAWIAETIRRGIPNGNPRAAVPPAPGRRARSTRAQRPLVCRWL